MRLIRIGVLICILGVGLFAEAQKTQIIQTYVYQISKGDIKQNFKKNLLQLTILSPSLLAFMDAEDLQDRMERQVVRFNNAYTEFSAANQSIQSYINSLHTKLKFNLNQIVYDLEYIGGGKYNIKNVTKSIKDLTKCSFVIQKSLSTYSSKRKDFVINLDSQRFFGNVLATHKYLQCLRK